MQELHSFKNPLPWKGNLQGEDCLKALSLIVMQTPNKLGQKAPPCNTL